ncbi:hypothetical protein ACVBEF_09380 [Glaciimonas sp. GG7]
MGTPKTEVDMPSNSMKSIAVLAQVFPSVSLFLMVTILALTMFLIGALVGFGVIGKLDSAVSVVLSFFSMLLSIYWWLNYRRSRHSVRIIIHANGQIGVVEIAANSAIDNANQVSTIVHLLIGSTLWARLLLLHFRLDDGRMKFVVILPDCVSEDVFRTLSVACRWIASRGDSDNPMKVVYEEPIS